MPMARRGKFIRLAGPEIVSIHQWPDVSSAFVYDDNNVHLLSNNTVRVIVYKERNRY